MAIPEQVYTIVKTLPEEQASEILAFAEFIRAKHLNIEPPSTTDTTISWPSLVESLAGTWAQDFPSLEEIRAESGSDILRETL
jgi:hypothetical protein